MVSDEAEEELENVATGESRMDTDRVETIFVEPTEQSEVYNQMIVY